MKLNIPRTPQYRLHLTVGEHSVHHIRRIVRSLLREWGLAELTFTVELGVSELVTNVVRHVPDRRCTVVVARRTAGVRVEVTDGFRRLPSMPDAPDPESESGRGLALLDALTGKWGVTPWAGGGKTVWFECGNL
ncbi:Anti-sigma regulatory factor (Ser/Thr protein kinase) [Streptomyces sp. 2231.1]|uniref:ATP-binding protein n=1 Tax=Streptomyces sp. 2231.1 TaxID=1855347 RepID=UPI0008992312|nr:ATP-binding protein [Streptomyces sp. 2231.1]SEC92171.1 Anti-sigma regulatory factor (Ser/Thr protein kinase) [Streptomyces sp. 2231.1]